MNTLHNQFIDNSDNKYKYFLFFFINICIENERENKFLSEIKNNKKLSILINELFTYDCKTNLTIAVIF
jgi:hypothetical protein